MIMNPDGEGKQKMNDFLEGSGVDFEALFGQIILHLKWLEGV